MLVFRKEDGEQDFAQKEGVDYIELFYRVVMHTSTRFCYWRLFLNQILSSDGQMYEQHFLHGELVERFYMRQLEGLFRFVKMVWYVSQGSRHTAWMSPRQGYMEFDSDDRCRE